MMCGCKRSGQPCTSACHRGTDCQNSGCTAHAAALSAPEISQQPAAHGFEDAGQQVDLASGAGAAQDTVQPIAQAAGPQHPAVGPVAVQQPGQLPDAAAQQAAAIYTTYYNVAIAQHHAPRSAHAYAHTMMQNMGWVQIG